MMIQGISDIRRLSRVGKIHLGIKKKNARGNEYPDAVDYFVVKASETTPQSSVDSFQKVYGKTPRELTVMIPVDDASMCWDQFYKRYGKTKAGDGKLLCKGDGRRANRLNLESGELEEVDCLGPEDCPYAENEGKEQKKCKKIINFQFVLPDVDGLGVWQIDSSSFNGIVSINSDIETIRYITGKGVLKNGRVHMIPLVLRLISKKAIVKGKQQIIFHLRLDFKGNMYQLMEHSPQKAAALAKVGVPEIDHGERPRDQFPVPQDADPEVNQDPESRPTEWEPSHILWEIAESVGLSKKQYQDIVLKCTRDGEVNDELEVIGLLTSKKMPVDDAIKFRSKFSNASAAMASVEEFIQQNSHGVRMFDAAAARSSAQSPWDTAKSLGLTAKQFGDMLMKCPVEDAIVPELEIMDRLLKKKMSIEEAIRFRAKFPAVMAFFNKDKKPEPGPDNQTDDLNLAIEQEFQRLGFAKGKKDMLIKNFKDKAALLKRLQNEDKVT